MTSNVNLPESIDLTIEGAASRQILAAITHFNNGEFECAITLAGAAEGMLPEPSESSSYIFGVVRNRKDKDFQINLVINWLKHGGSASIAITQFEAALVIARAISKFVAVTQATHSQFQEFMEWGRDAGHFPWYPEFKAVRNESGEVILYDIFFNESGARYWIGSRRTWNQCVDAYNSHKRALQRGRQGA